MKSVFRIVVDPDTAQKLLAESGSGKIIPDLDSSRYEINLKFLNKNAQFKYINSFL